MLGILIQNGSAAVFCNVVSCNGCLETIRRDVHIDTVKIQRGLFKVELRVIHDGIGFAAGGAADIVHRAVLVHLTGGQGSGAGVAVVIGCKVEIDTGSIARLRQVFDICIAAAHRVGVVSRHMGHYHLPGAVALGCILYQPLGKLLQVILFGCMIQHGDIHVASLHRIPCCGNTEHGLGSDRSIAVIVCLMVAYHMDHIRVTDPLQGKQVQRILPLVVIADIIHCITQLDAKVIPAIQILGNASHTLQGSLLLNICQQVETSLFLSGRHRETANFGPVIAVAHAEVICASGVKTCQSHSVDTVDLLTGGIGNQATHALNLHSSAHIGIGGNLSSSLVGTAAGIAHPSDGLAVGGQSHVVDDVIRGTSLIAHSIIAEQCDLERAVAFIVRSAQIYTALACRQVGDVDLTVLIGNAQKLIVGVHINADGSLAVADDRNGSGHGTTCHGGICMNAVHCLNGISCPLRREASRILVDLADIRPRRLRAAVRTLDNAHADTATLNRRGGNAHGNGCQRAGGALRVVDAGDFYSHHTLSGIIVICTSDTIREVHFGGIVASQRDVCTQRRNGCRITAVQFQLPELAHCGCALNVQRYAGQFCIICHYGEIARLASDIAVAVLEIERDGVQSFAEVHQSRGAAQNVLVVRTAISAVKIEVGRLHTCSKGIGALIIIIGYKETQITGVQGHTIFQFGLGAVVVHQLNGVHHRGGDILIVGAVNYAQVIQQDITLEVTLVQLHAVGGIPADTAGSDHSPEQHTAFDQNSSTSILGQVRLQILPAGLQPFARRGAAVTEIDIGVGPALPVISAGGDLGSEPRNRGALGNVSPHTQSSGGTADVQVIAQTKTRTVCSGKACPVVFQFDSLVAKADDIGELLVRVRHHGALHYAAAPTIVVRGHSIRRHAGEALHGGANIRVVPGVLIAAVDNHDGSHADIQSDGGRQLAKTGSDNWAAGVFHVSSDGEQIAGERAGILVGNTPCNVAGLQVNHLGLIGGLEAQVADVVIVQAQLSGGEGHAVRVLNMQHGGADRLIAADQIDRHIAGLAGGNEGCGGIAATHGGLANSPHSLIADGKGHVLRQGLSRCTGEVHSVCRQGDG